MTLGKHLVAVVAVCLVAQADPATTPRNSPDSPGTAPRKDLSESLIQRPIVFEPNVGQFGAGVRYRASAPGMSLSLTDAAAVLSLGSEPGPRRQVRITPVNASRHARPRALDRLAGVVNHFESAAPSEWHAGVPTYGRVRYPAVYPGIDLVYHGSPEQLEYDFVVGRGADPSRIVVRFDGADRVEIDPTGDLLIHVGDSIVRQRAPYAFQEHGRERRRVDARYRLTKAGDVAFAIGVYDRRLPLVIDPILLYSSYLNAYGPHVAVDAAGYIIVVTRRPYADSEQPPGIKVERLTPDGQAAIYTTLIGADSVVEAVATTSAGEAIVVGWTGASDFPLVNPSQGYPGAGSSSNAFAFKLGPSGDFVFSTYLGGMDFDTAYAVSVNGSGTIVVGGATTSQDFPGVDGLRVGWPQPGVPGGFVTVFSSAGARLHGALLPAVIGAVEVDSLGAVYLAGTTNHTTWPTTPESFQPAPYCGVYGALCSQGVLAKVSADLGSLVYSTYLHTTGPQDREVNLSVTALAVDATGAAYILGTSGKGSFAATPGALQEQCALDSCPFLAKLNPAGSGRVYSTFLDGYPKALQVDSRGNAYVAGAYAPPTPNALQPRPADGRLLVTTDGGTTWRPAQGSKQAHPLRVAHDTAPVLYALDFTDGISKSTDLGDHWEVIDRGSFRELVVAPSNANVVYAVYDSPVHQLMHRSTDGGATWGFVETPIDAGVFAVDPQDPQTLYIGGPAGLFKSVNGGNAWTPAGSGIDAQATIRAVVVAPSNHSVLLATASFTVTVPRSELYRSVDGGASWTQTTSATRPSDGPVAFDPLDATRVYAIDGSHILRSTDGGATWTSFAESNTPCRAIAVTGTPDPTVFVVCQDGVARAIDTGGPSPVPLTAALGNGFVYQIAVDPVDPRVLVAAAFPAGDGLLSVLDPTGARMRYASYFGGADFDGIETMALGSGGALAIAGTTWSPDLPLVNPRIPERRADRFDAFVALLRIPLPAVVIDAPAGGSIGEVFTVSGWAIDTGAPEGAGIDAVHVWAFPSAGGAPAFVGVASHGGARPDVGNAFGAQFSNSGFTLMGGSLPEGPYTLAAFARSTVSGTFDAAVRSIQVVSGGRMAVDAPTPGASVNQPFAIAGWALDTGAPWGTGVDAIHIWAYPSTGGSPVFLGVPAGVSRPDVAVAFGDARFEPSGYSLTVTTLPPGTYTVVVYARSTVTGAFSISRSVQVIVN